MAVIRPTERELASAREIPDSAARAVKLQRLAEGLAGDERTNMLEEAYQAARGIVNAAKCAEVLQRLAPDLPPERQRSALLGAVAAADRIDKAGLRISKLVTLANDLGEFPALALEAAHTIDDDRFRAAVISRTSSSLSPDECHLALELIRKIRDDSLKAEALQLLASELAASQFWLPAQIAREIADSKIRAETLYGLSQYMGDGKSEALRDAWTSAKTLPDSREKAVLLEMIAGEMPADVRLGPLLDALAAMRLAQPDGGHIAGNSAKSAGAGLADISVRSFIIDTIGEVKLSRESIRSDLYNIAEKCISSDNSEDFQEQCLLLLRLVNENIATPSALPEKPPKLWTPRPRGRPAPGAENVLFAFIRETYGPYFEAGFRNELRPFIFRQDRALYDAIKHYERGGRELPPDIAMPTRPEIVQERFERAKREGLGSLSGPERHSVVKKLRRMELKQT
jgi:hypothetical protein